MGQRINKYLGFIILISLFCLPCYGQSRFDLTCSQGQPFTPLVTNNPQTGNLKANACIDSTGSIIVPFSSGFGAPVPGITGPTTRSLTAYYRMLTGESVSALVDYSGNNNNGVGTTGTAPTITANTGGLTCPGNGAALVPSNLNNSLTMMYLVSFQGNGQTLGGFYSGIAGNGGGTASNAISFGLSGSGQASPSSSMRLTSVGNSAQHSFSFEQMNGVFTIGLILDTNDRLFINGKEVTYLAQASSAGQQTLGQYQLCGSASGQGAGVSTFMPNGSQIIGAAFYNSKLSTGEMLATHNFLINDAIYRGVTTGLQTSVTGNPDNLICMGDSITAGSGITTPWCSVLQAGSTSWNKTIFAQAGIGLSSLVLTANNGAITANLNPNAGKSAIVLMGGTNDIAQSLLTPAQTETILQSLSRTITSTNTKLFYIDMIDRTGQSANKDTYNDLSRLTWSTFTTVHVSLNDNANIAADGANAGTCFQGDHIHPVQGCAYNEIAVDVDRSLGHYYGAQDFSTATVYSSPAAAPTATTAGSETTNTVTTTFAATPANCNVGDEITFAGITPVGYNGTFRILTRSGTQTTTWNNTTGLGAITVQGTGVCSQQKYTDGYYIVNFGAGNSTLDSCKGTSGQQPIGIKNINAAATTLVSFPGSANQSAELIDGAANFSLAANTVAFFQARIVSSASGGCNWFKVN